MDFVSKLKIVHSYNSDCPHWEYVTRLLVSVCYSIHLPPRMTVIQMNQKFNFQYLEWYGDKDKFTFVFFYQVLL